MRGILLWGGYFAVYTTLDITPLFLWKFQSTEKNLDIPTIKIKNFWHKILGGKSIVTMRMDPKVKERGGLFPYQRSHSNPRDAKFLCSNRNVLAPVFGNIVYGEVERQNYVVAHQFCLTMFGFCNCIQQHTYFPDCGNWQRVNTTYVFQYKTNMRKSVVWYREQLFQSICSGNWSIP